MASRRTLFRFDPTGGGHWTKIRSFEGKDLARITRIAVSPAGNRIALVAARQAGGSQ
jgi:hypothetical protein